MSWGNILNTGLSKASKAASDAAAKVLTGSGELAKKIQEKADKAIDDKVKDTAKDVEAKALEMADKLSKKMQKVAGKAGHLGYRITKDLDASLKDSAKKIGDTALGVFTQMGTDAKQQAAELIQDAKPYLDKVEKKAREWAADALNTAARNPVGAIAGAAAGVGAGLVLAPKTTINALYHMAKQELSSYKKHLAKQDKVNPVAGENIPAKELACLPCQCSQPAAGDTGLKKATTQEKPLSKKSGWGTPAAPVKRWQRDKTTDNSTIKVMGGEGYLNRESTVEKATIDAKGEAALVRMSYKKPGKFGEFATGIDVLALDGEVHAGFTEHGSGTVGELKAAKMRGFMEVTTGNDKFIKAGTKVTGELFSTDAKWHALLGDSGRYKGVALGGQAGARVAQATIENNVSVPIGWLPGVPDNWTLDAKMGRGVSFAPAEIGGGAYGYLDRKTERYYTGIYGKAGLLLGIKWDTELSVGPPKK